MDISDSEFSDEPASSLPFRGPSRPSTPLLSHDIEIDCDDHSVSDDGMDSDDTMSQIASSVESEAHSVELLTSDLEHWRKFNEFQDLDEPISHEAMIQKLDEMLGPGDEGLWGLGWFILL
jgi:hypothetical protein